MIVWLNGVLQDVEAARIDPTDRGFLLGDGLFETILARGGNGVRLDSHFARLREGMKLLGFSVPQTDDELGVAVSTVLAANGLVDAAVRLTVTSGTGPRGLVRPNRLSPTVLVTAGPVPSPRPEPVRLIIARSTRRNQDSPLSRIKSLAYLDNVLARREALAAGADDALMLNSDGRVACASAANVVLRIDGMWATPPVAEGALPGVRRGELLASGEVVERRLSAEDAARADRVLLTTALADRDAVLVTAGRRK